MPLSLRTKELVSIGNIVIDRKAVNRYVLKTLQDMKQGKPFRPVHLQLLPNGKFKIREGKDRVVAAKLWGMKVVLARFSKRPSQYCH